MKELTIEQKAKAYDEVIKKAKALYDSSETMSGCSVILETIFPELKESEDEQSKNWILEYLHDGLRKSDEQFKDQFKCAIAWLEKQGMQKPAEWSEEDEKNLLEIKRLIGSYRAGADEYRLDSWVDSFKNRVQPKQEWSEEDKEIINRAASAIYSFSNVVESKQEDEELSELADKLQELIKPQKQWKPNKAQLKALNDLNITGNISCIGQGQVLIELYNDLKKL